MLAQRPPCPKCGMAMILTHKTTDAGGHEHGTFECLRCGHVVKSGTEPESEPEPRT